MPSKKPARAAVRLHEIQRYFHALILERTSCMVPRPELELPQLKVPLPARRAPAWLEVPGMCGGFAYGFQGRGPALTLVTESWCRAVDGSGQRHEITESGCRLVEEGFV